jgi:hypothetical protein
MYPPTAVHDLHDPDSWPDPTSIQIVDRIAKRLIRTEREISSRALAVDGKAGSQAGYTALAGILVEFQSLDARCGWQSAVPVVRRESARKSENPLMARGAV